MRSQNLKAGATAPSMSLTTRLTVWRDSHRSMARQSAQRLLEKPAANFITLLTLAIAIALPTLLHIGVRNIELWTGHSSHGLELDIYLQSDLSNEQGRKLAVDIRNWEGVINTAFISPQDALQLLETHADLHAGDIIASLPENPLPASVNVALATHVDYAAAAQRIAAKAKALDGVESVAFNLEWFRKAQAFVEFAQRLQTVISVLLALAVALVIGNTIKLAIETRKEEIMVAKLVGATNAYVRRPFLYMGAWLGGLSAFLALLLCSFSVLALAYYIKPLESAYDTNIGITGLPLRSAVFVLLLGLGLGWLGAWLICGNHIRELDPK